MKNLGKRRKTSPRCRTSRTSRVTLSTLSSRPRRPLGGGNGTPMSWIRAAFNTSLWRQAPDLRTCTRRDLDCFRVKPEDVFFTRWAPCRDFLRKVPGTFLVLPSCLVAGARFGLTDVDRRRDIAESRSIQRVEEILRGLTLVGLASLYT